VLSVAPTASVMERLLAATHCEAAAEALSEVPTASSVEKRQELLVLLGFLGFPFLVANSASCVTLPFRVAAVASCEASWLRAQRRGRQL